MTANKLHGCASVLHWQQQCWWPYNIEANFSPYFSQWPNDGWFGMSETFISMISYLGRPSTLWAWKKMRKLIKWAPWMCLYLRQVLQFNKRQSSSPNLGEPQEHGPAANYDVAVAKPFISEFSIILQNDPAAMTDQQMSAPNIPFSIHTSVRPCHATDFAFYVQLHCFTSVPPFAIFHFKSNILKMYLYPVDSNIAAGVRSCEHEFKPRCRFLLACLHRSIRTLSIITHQYIWECKECLLWIRMH